MAFQTAIKACPPQALPGDRATLNSVTYAAHNYLALEGARAGCFVWRSPEQPGHVGPNGSGQPLGLVERWLAYPDFNLRAPGSLDIPAGYVVQVALAGQYYAVAATASAIGHKVFAFLANGGLATAMPGATVSGAVETNWFVVDPGAANELITISTWSE